MTTVRNAYVHDFPPIDTLDVQVISMTSEGYSPREIAAALHKTEHEVRLQIRRLEDRLGAINPASLVRRAYEQGVLKVGS